MLTKSPLIALFAAFVALFCVSYRLEAESRLVHFDRVLRDHDVRVVPIGGTSNELGALRELASSNERAVLSRRARGLREELIEGTRRTGALVLLFLSELDPDWASAIVIERCGVQAAAGDPTFCSFYMKFALYDDDVYPGCGNLEGLNLSQRYELCYRDQFQVEKRIRSGTELPLSSALSVGLGELLFNLLLHGDGFKVGHFERVERQHRFRSAPSRTLGGPFSLNDPMTELEFFVRSLLPDLESPNLLSSHSRWRTFFPFDDLWAYWSDVETSILRRYLAAMRLLSDRDLVFVDRDVYCSQTIDLDQDVAAPGGGVERLVRLTDWGLPERVRSLSEYGWDCSSSNLFERASDKVQRFLSLMESAGFRYDLDTDSWR